jgi:peptide/nickel transport system substrate-binding protein
MRITKWISSTLLIIGILMGGLAYAQTPGGILQVAVQGEPLGLNLILTPSAETYQLLMYNVVEPLLRYTAEGELVPLLAQSYEIEETASGARYTFYLRSGVVFHNGEPFTAYDVKYTFDRLLDPDIASPNAAPFSFLRDVEVIDDLTVHFVTEGKAAPLLGYLASNKGVGIIPAGSDMEELKTHPIGTGPFAFAEWAPGDHLTLVKNHHYWEEGSPYLDEVIVKFIPDQAASLTALLAGDVDMIDKMVSENALVLESNPLFKVIVGSMNTPQLLAINNARPPFDNILIRRALCYAIDRDEIIAGTVARPEWGTAIGSHMSPLNPFYVDLVGMYPHDPEYARQLLAQAGYPNGFQTTLYLPQPFEFHIRTGEIIAYQLREVGIDCSLQVLEWGQWIERVYSQWDYDMTVIGHDQGVEPAVNFTKPFERVQADGSSGYYFQYSNPFVRELLARGKETFDIAERKTIYAMVQTIIASDAMAVWIQDIPQFEGMRSGVMGYRQLPIYVLDLARIYLSDR